MRTIQKESIRNNTIFAVCLAVFICMNILLTLRSVRLYSVFMEDYRKINQVEKAFNDSRTYFHLYNKEREETVLAQYEEGLEEIYTLLDSISEDISGDRQSRMMYRIVLQMMDHRKEVIDNYNFPEGNYPDHGIDYIEELDLLLENNLNLLTGSYRNYFMEAYEGSLKQQRRSVLAINLSLILSGIGIMLVNSLFFRRLIASIKRLRDAADEISHRNFEGPDVPDDEYEEINVVGHTFNDMKHTIREMIAEINRNFEVRERLSEQMLENEKQKRRLAESKMKELQMQINPHFLFNTLSLVIRSVQLDEKETAVMLIKATSRILRSSIETQALTIPLDDEIELLESYLYIQRVHCRGRISLELDVKKSYMGEDIQVPPLIIQPLVENAIMHGLENVTENGRVSIIIVEKQDYIETSVSDNGCGLDDQILEDLKAKKAMKRIGLRNVMERLQLLYRRDDAMTIQTGPDGTQITIRFFKGNFAPEGDPAAGKTEG